MMKRGGFGKLCRIAGETVVRYRLIGEGDRILAALSGGRDSMVMMHLLEHLRHRAPVKFTVVCATFDPGFAGFRAEAVEEYCRINGWEHRTVRMDIPAILEEKGFTDSPCVLCSRLRRGKLSGLAKELHCGKLALGQHLDDVISSFLMSLCRGQGLSSMAPLVRPAAADAPTVIRPLALVPRQLIRECAAELGVPEGIGKCTYEEQLKTGDRAVFEALVEDLARRIPDVRSNIARSLTHLEPDHLLLPPENE